MTSYYWEGLQCPGCATTFVAHRTRSHNTFGATFYTDAYVSGPTYDRGSALVVCPTCEKVAWRDSLTPQFGQGDSEWIRNPERDLLPWGAQVEHRHYLEALRAAMWRTQDDEIYLRTCVWWNENHKRRARENAFIPLSREEEENLRRLLTLLEGGDSNSNVMRAEIFRELGEFEACLAELRRVAGAALAQAVGAIERLANDRDSLVAILTPGTDGD